MRTDRRRRPWLLRARLGLWVSVWLGTRMLRAWLGGLCGLDKGLAWRVVRRLVGGDIRWENGLQETAQDGLNADVSG